jgi:hypothetical protein
VTRHVPLYGGRQLEGFMTVDFPNSEFELKDVLMIRLTKAHDFLRLRFRPVDPSASGHYNGPFEKLRREVGCEGVLNYEHTFIDPTVPEDECQVILNDHCVRSGKLNKLKL